MDRENASLIARRIGWLSDTPVAFQAKLLSRCDLLQFPKGGAVYHAGDEAGGLFGVVDGSIKLYLLSPEGGSGLGHVGRRGFWTGDLAAFTGRPRRLSITAASDCHLLRLPRASLLSIMEEDPGSWRHLAVLIAGNLALALDSIDALKRDDPVKRVAATILNLVGSDGSGNVVIEISQSDLGAIARIARTAANGALRKLQKRGWIHCGYGTVEVRNEAALSRFVRGS